MSAPGIAVQLFRGRVSLRLHARSLIAGTAAGALVTALFVVALATGGFVIAVPAVLRALVGAGTPAQEFVVTTLRLPRAVLGLTAGAALGIGGALFQGVTRNPLASPDVIGLQSGATTGALLQLVVFGGGTSAVSLGALAGAAGAVLLVTALVPLRQAGGARFVLVGIAVAALFAAVNEVLLTRTDLTTAMAALIWQTGSLNGAGWAEVWPVALALALLLPAALWAGAGLRTLALGEDIARSLGAPVTAVRLTALAAAVGLSATATAGAGPLLFVALAAGQIAQRLTGRPGPAILTAGAVGALLTLTADLSAQRLFGAAGLPAGVVTGALGGVYLATLLARQRRSA